MVNKSFTKQSSLYQEVACFYTEMNQWLSLSFELKIGEQDLNAGREEKPTAVVNHYISRSLVK
jgi:hypothetical protein